MGEHSMSSMGERLGGVLFWAGMIAAALWVSVCHVASIEISDYPVIVLGPAGLLVLFAYACRYVLTPR